MSERNQVYHDPINRGVINTVGGEVQRTPRPRVVVSKCLEFEACRYNGQVIRDAFVKNLEKHVDFLPVCPEVEIGLGVPRFPIRIISQDSKSRLVQPATGRDFTENMNKFSNEFLSSLGGVDGFILKFRSPSCGMKDVRFYAKAEKSPSVGKGPGFFGGQVLDRFSGLAIEDEGRLRSLKIREHFLTKLFALALFRSVKECGKMLEIVDYHTKNKFLLMSYNQKEMRFLGNIVANRDRKPFEHVVAEYEKHLHRSLANPPRRSSNINTLMHILGFFSKSLSKDERQFFLETLELYREGRILFTSALSLAKAWAVRFRNEYLLSQTFFEPYPRELMEWSDAGRPIDL
jgi:uncharacterized protein YbgA (DUF1722 family)/uncharacterized protein YbbK (DUF523 family)